MKLLLVTCTLWAGLLAAETVYEIESNGVRIHVIEFALEENHGFELVDGRKLSNFPKASDHYSKANDVFVVNGGYFDGNLNPVGYCKISSVELSDTLNPKLSGIITITDTGILDLHWKDIPKGNFPDILQTGPYIIDPGGKVGIHTRSGKEAKRTLIGKTSDGDILIISTDEVYLYDLAEILKSEIPALERALNLDGGPSAALICEGRKLDNLNPVSNFLKKQR